MRGRDAGYWIGFRHRRLTVAEGCRLQGLRPELVCLLARAAIMRNLLGNSMASCVVQRILVRFLRLLRPHERFEDPWETGDAQRRLAVAAAFYPPSLVPLLCGPDPFFLPSLELPPLRPFPPCLPFLPMPLPPDLSPPIISSPLIFARAA